MSMEADLVAILKSLCLRVFADVAPTGAAKPYVTWQGLGGESIYALNNTPIDKRNTLMQINVWAVDRMQSTTLARSIEAAIAASPAFVAKPVNEPISVYEDDTQLHGAIQRYEIWHAR